MNPMTFKCSRCGIERESLETPCLICNHKPEPQDKAPQPGAAQMEGCPKDAEPKPSPAPIDGNRTVKWVSLWVSVYGWLMLVYWLFDSLTFFSLLDTNPGESFIVWGYSCIRGAIGLSVIILASNIRKSPHRAVKLLGVVLGLLIFRAFMMMALDNAFFSFHVADLITGHSPERRSGVPGMGVLMMLIIYVWQTRRTLKQAPINVASRPEQKRQPIAETHGNHSTIKNVKDWIASNRTPCAMAVAVIVVASVAFAFKNQDRYYLVTNASGGTYRIDKTTGKTWLVTRSRMVEVEQVEKPTTQTPVSKDPAQQKVSSKDADRSEFESLIGNPKTVPRLLSEEDFADSSPEVFTDADFSDGSTAKTNVVNNYSLRQRLKLKDSLLNKIGYVKNRVKEDVPDADGLKLSDFQNAIQSPNFNTADDELVDRISKAIDEKFSKAVNKATGR